MKKYLFTGLLLIVGIASATSWQQANLQYIQTINGKNYTAEVTLLKPESYFIAQHASNPGDKINVDLSEMGLDMVTMDIVKLSPYKGIAIKDTNGKTNYKQVDEINWEGKTNRPVVATYKTWAQEVYSYSFIDSSTGQTSKINSTSGHRFYVANKHNYVAIKDVTPNDTLIDQNGQSVKLVCPNYAVNHDCGERYNKDGNPIAVYNFEVYQLHRYYVTDKSKQQQLAAILVHNPCHYLTAEELLNHEKMWTHYKQNQQSFMSNKMAGIDLVFEGPDFTASLDGSPVRNRASMYIAAHGYRLKSDIFLWKKGEQSVRMKKNELISFYNIITGNTAYNTSNRRVMEMVNTLSSQFKNPLEVNLLICYAGKMRGGTKSLAQSFADSTGINVRARIDRVSFADFIRGNVTLYTPNLHPPIQNNLPVLPAINNQ